MELSEFRRILQQVMLLPIVALLLLAFILIWQIRGSDVTVGQIEQTDQRIALARLVESLVVDEETGLRGYQVTAEILGPVSGPKINIVHYKNKTGYRRRLGHRQKYTQVKITGISTGQAKAARASSGKAAASSGGKG